MKTFITPNGKELELYHIGFSVRCRFKTGGELPAELDCMWTDGAKAEQAINVYLNDKEPLHIQVKDENGIYQKVKNPKKNAS